MLVAVASPVEMACERGEAVHARVAVRQVGEADMFVQQSARREGQSARRVGAHMRSCRRLVVVLLDGVLRQSAVLVERLTTAFNSAVIGAVVRLHVPPEMRGSQERSITARLLATILSVIGV